MQNQFINTKRWSMFYLKDLCKIAPATVTREEIDQRNKNTLKLTGLPFGTTAYDLKPILEQTKAKTCFIPRTRNQYGRARYAYVAFETEEEVLLLLTNDLMGSVNDTALYWVAPDIKTCHKCGSMDYLVI